MLFTFRDLHSSKPTPHPNKGESVKIRRLEIVEVYGGLSRIATAAHKQLVLKTLLLLCWLKTDSTCGHRG